MMGNTYVDNITNAVLLFSNPLWSGDASIPSTIIKNITALSADIAYSDNLESNITILTSQYASTQNGIIQGLLYVPDLPDDNPCKALEPSHVPQSAVRRKDLPPHDYNLIALVPWYTGTCTRLYMESAASDPLRGFITYIPATNSSEKPPDVNDRVWNLHDHGAWKDSSKFPVYAISGNAGLAMMNQLALYSGDIHSVPYGRNITELYSPNAHDYIRIWTEIHINTPSALPTIWVFILVCIGVLVAFVALVSCLMHCLQRRRRCSLERRVASGEVNLEAMNITRVRVPRHHVDEFPLFTYNYEPNHTSPPPSPTSPQRSPQLPPHAHMRDDSIGRESAAPAEEKGLVSPRSTVTGLTNSSNATDYQPRCTICLRDYENRVSIIRELPCGHIYHPDCIDEFLEENSSLCPQCKASVLPKGFCPPVTNSMVRRERAVRRLRGHVTVEDGEAQEGTRELYHPSQNVATMEVHQAPERHSPTAVARVRMRNLAGSASDGGEDSEGQAKWKRLTRMLFPGFR